MNCTAISIIFILLQVIHCLSNADLFFLSDADLFQMGIDQWRKGLHNQLGRCIISDDPHACTHYAKVCTPDDCIGLPDLYGTGCLNGCWGPPNTYYNYQSSKIPVCTGNIITDGANMLRIGILKGYCGITSNSSSTNNSSTNNSSTPCISQTNSETMVSALKTNIDSSNMKQNLFWIGWVVGILLLIGLIVVTVLLVQQKQQKTKLESSPFASKEDVSSNTANFPQ